MNNEQIQKVREALTLALTICDAVPTRLHQNKEDSQLAHLGRLVNAQPDGAHGYAVIRDALAAINAPAAQPASAPVASIDTPEFRELLIGYRHELVGYQEERRAAVIAHIDAWGKQQRKEGYREGRVSAHRAAQKQAARTTSDIAYESLSPERRKQFNADMVLLDQSMQDHRRERERRQKVVPVELERRVADARGTGVHQDRKG